LLITISWLIGRQIAILQRRSTQQWERTGELSVERYRPMCRLLESDDLAFLRKQPGATPQMVKRLRKQRAQVFRGYLKCLECDFQQASETLMAMLIDSDVDRTDLIPSLLRTRLRFSTGIFMVRCRLVLYRWNISQKPIARLLEIFERLEIELRALTPLPEGAGA